VTASRAAVFEREYPPWRGLLSAPHRSCTLGRGAHFGEQGGNWLLAYTCGPFKGSQLRSWDYEVVLRGKIPDETEIVGLKIAGIAVRRR
jgi:hypothetical protein